MPRKKRVTPEPETPKPPVCTKCGREMDWRDLMYGGRAREATDDTPAVGATCKPCNRKAQRATIKGVFSAAMRVVEGKRGKRLVPVVKRASRRVNVASSGKFATDRTVNWGAWILLKRARLERARKSQAPA